RLQYSTDGYHAASLAGPVSRRRVPMSVTPKWALAILGAVALAATAPQPTSAAPARSASRVERSLAGVRLGTRATTLVQAIGQPTRIELGAGTGAVGGGVAAG